ncbi:MAG: AI-2E family transporter [Rubrobacteraceae bacterium]|nr:AI-2E family transporter [Rubrobacteraceae bacterium]MDQ3317743.1 AI-2E family transporter [Actinomycetota bacterium]
MPAKKLVVSTYLQYIALALGVLILVSFLRQISGVILTFLAAGVLAYALNPIVRRLEGWRVPRVIAVVGVLLVLILASVAAVLTVVVPAITQIRTIVENPQAIAQQANALTEQAQSLPFVGQYVTELDQDQVLQLIRSNAPSAGQVLNVATGVIGGVFGVFGAIFNLLLLILVSTYLLLERERITRALLRTIPETIRDQSLELFHAVEQTLISYLRGQLLLCFIMGVIGWAIMFFTVGNYALLIGAWVAVTEIIPVLGAFLGAVPAILIALLVRDGGFTTALIVAGLFLVAQQLEGNVLVPKIQGGSTGVHPLWVLFGTLAGTALYGVVGAIFAVPIVAIVAATIRYLRTTLTFERWSRPPLEPAEEEPPRTEAESLPEAAGLGDTRRAEDERKG